MTQQEERARRWRLILGAEGTQDSSASLASLAGDDAGMDAALAALYGGQGEGGGKKDNRFVGMGKSSPSVARWLGDIRGYFPSSVVQVMQRDAIDRIGLKQLLFEPELLEAVEPNVHLVANLLSLSKVMPAKTRETARLVVCRVVEDLEKRLASKTQQAVMGALNRATRNRRPKHNEIDWPRTIKANLRHYQSDLQTIIPETRIGYGRKRSALREIVLCVDQSGSMATSVVFAGIFGAVLASLPALKTHVVVYDTEVADLTDQLSDPVEVLFGTQLGGGNDTPRALKYCQGLITRPEETILILISDLYEGALSAEMNRRLGEFKKRGVQVIVLLALSDDGRPSYEVGNASILAGLGIPVFACTPDLFPELMAAAINRDDIGSWAAARDIVTARAQE